MGMLMTLYYTTHTSAIGTLLLVGNAQGLHYLTLLPDGETAEARLDAMRGDSTGYEPLPGFFASSLAAIDRYLQGDGPLRLPYALVGGTPLQRMVWLEIAKIPYGETISYSTLAERVGFPRAVRAVASACGANPVPLAIPCHRVLAKDGTLGGFSLGGLETKEFLLLVESQKQRAVA